MKNQVDFFPDTPESFHIRVEATLEKLEEKDMKCIYRKRKMIVAIAAILIMLIAASAVAVVQGNALRTQLGEAGGEKLAAQVQDVHASDAENGFSFTIDEILWRDEKMYVSYTAAVPEDGNVYLFSPVQIELDGEQLVNFYGIDSEFFNRMFAVGGEYGASVSQIMQLEVPEELSGEHLFSSKCLFMQTDKKLSKIEIEELAALCTEPDADGNENQMMKNADTLYYYDTTEKGDPAPVIWLHYYPEVRTVMDEHDRVTAEALESAGIAKYADMREICVPICKTEGGDIRFNDAAQRIFDMGSFSIEVTKLEISQFNTSFKAFIRKEGGVSDEWTEDEPYGQFYSLCKADGSDLGIHDWTIGEGGAILTESGEKVYRIAENSEGIYPLEDLTEVYLAPSIFDENGVFVQRDMTRAVRLEPVFNPDLPAEGAELAQDPAETDDLSS